MKCTESLSSKTLKDLVCQIDILTDNRTYLVENNLLIFRFIAMSEKIMKDADIFMNHFHIHFAPLAKDKVPNVRIAVAKALDKVFKKKSKLFTFFFFNLSYMGQFFSRTCSTNFLEFGLFVFFSQKY